MHTISASSNIKSSNKITCCDCQQQLLKSCFSKAQFKKSLSERRCQVCAQTREWETSNGNNSIEKQQEIIQEQYSKNNNNISSTNFIGRIKHLGSSALSTLESTASFRLDRRQDSAARGQRQLNSMMGMKLALQKYHTKQDSDTSNNADLLHRLLEETALELEIKYFQKTTRNIDYINNNKSGLEQSMFNSDNECVIMSCQRWFIAMLPKTIIEQILQVAMLYRTILNNFEETLVSKQLPNSSVVVPSMIPSATQDNRTDIIILLNELFAAPSSGVNVWIYSEVDNEIISAWRGFKIDKTKQEQIFSNCKTSQDILCTISSSKSIWFDPSECYWCETNSLATHATLKLCTNCRKISYCCKQCQIYDWKSFHKNECQQKPIIGTKRLDYLQQHYEQQNQQVHDDTTSQGTTTRTYTHQMAQRHDINSIWRGDVLLLHLIHPSTTDSTNPITDKTKGFPRGLFIRPREYNAPIFLN